MANTAATLSLNIPAITALCTGPRGSQILAASGLPTNPNNTYGGNPGLSGDYYIDTSTGLYYGPKTTIWSTIPLFSLNNSLTSFAYTLVNSNTSLIIPQYGNNKIFSTSNNSAILGGQNNTLTGDNSFILGSNITAAITGFTLVNNLSTTGTVYTSSGDSNLWYSAYTAISPNSANWNSVYTSFSGVSAQSSSVFTAVSPNSANWNSTYTTVTANSGNWQSAYGVTSTLAYISYTLNSSLSSIIPSRGTFTVSGTASNIGGGNFNNVLSSYSSVLGGKYNTASGCYSNITGGYSGRAIGNFSNIAGGICNTTSGYSSSIGGGFGNTASGSNAAIVAGCGNTASNCSTFIGGGRFNAASGNKAAIVGGLSNMASGDCSFIGGGTGNNDCGYSNVSILGSNICASQSNITYVNNLSSQGSIVGPSIYTIGGSNGVAAYDRNGTNTAFQMYKVGGSNYLWDTNGGNLVTLLSSGNVGIGASSPLARLHVSGIGQTTAAMSTVSNLSGSVYVQDLGYGGDHGGSIILGAARGAFTAMKALITDGNANTVGDLAFSTRNAISDATLTERLRIVSTGNVGIGTSSPTALLTIQGTSSFGTIHIVGLSANTEAAISFRDTSDTIQQAWVVGQNVGGLTTDDLVFYKNGPRLSITANGTINAQSNPITNCKTTAKAWVVFDGNTSPYSIFASYNISSVTRIASTNFYVNFTTAFANTNYAVFVSMSPSTTSSVANGIPYTGARETGRAQVYAVVATTSAAPADAADQIAVAVFAP
jgi:hypothetical protein